MPTTRQAPPELPGPEILREVLERGASSNAFLSLYDGYRYFRHEIRGQAGLIAYVDTPTAWVAAADPIGPEETRGELLAAFAAGAKQAGKAAALLPVSQQLAKLAREAGLSAIQIGNEPWISLSSFDERKTLDSVAIAKRLLAKGALVEPFDPLSITAGEHVALEEMTARWLESRASVPLGFLNRVRPWLYAHHKRYFRVIHHGRMVAYLATVPVPARRSWYLVDLIREPDAPLGATELLVIQAMSALKQEGALEVTLGMSPLSPVSDDERAYHPAAYRAMSVVFARFSALYGFRRLFEYKAKFRPTRWEPLYAVASPAFGPKACYGLFRAVCPEGVIRTGVAIAIKKARRFSFFELFSRVLSDRIVPRSPPRSWGEALFRCRTVLAIAGANMLFYLLTSDASTSRIRPAIESEFGYSFARFFRDGFGSDDVKAVVLSGFLHWNTLHLALNLLTLVLFGGLLEIIAGSTLVGACFVAGTLFSNLLTSAVLYPLIAVAHPRLLPHFAGTIDVGASLGVFACLGALIYFSKRPRAGAFALGAGTLAAAAFTQNLVNLNHIAAMGIGLLFGEYYASRKS